LHEAAAQYPTTFYGQLSIIALGRDPAEAIRVARDPQPDAQRMQEFAGRELVRAVAILTQWGDPGRARTFLLRVVEVYADPADATLAARLGGNLVRPDFGVWVARRAGVRGVVLPEAGWPMPFDPPAEHMEPAVSLAIMRQESNFDPAAISSANARGLMQLLPATAAQVARRLGERVNAAQLLTDPAQNMRLGSAYLREVLDQAGGCLPCAFAAYNAGPGRLRQWLAENGDPRIEGGPDIVDWTELIPFNETRNYVQRVTENVMVYRARRGVSAPHPMAGMMR
jgi:soluble lytic murein transglycosylase